MIAFIATNFEAIPDHLYGFVNRDRMSRQLGFIEFELKLCRIKLLPENQCIPIPLSRSLSNSFSL